MLVELKKSLMVTSCKTVCVNPNRSNIYWEKKVRLSNHFGNDSYRAILEPFAQDLAIQRDKFPMTMIYLKLKYCGYAYSLFERILNTNQYVGDSNNPAGRLFAQFHSPQTERMKKELIMEIKKENSTTREIFATSALGMGVDSPHVKTVIHVSPPSSLEAYIQEIGRAGRSAGTQGRAVLYYNNSDISKNKVHVKQSMKDYCQTTDACLRKLILEYFGFKTVKQDRCCSICDIESQIMENLPSTINEKVRVIFSCKSHLQELIKEILYKSTMNTPQCFFMLDVPDFDVNTLARNIMDGIEYITSELDLLNKYGIWDETCSSQIFSVVCKHTVLK